MSDLVEFLRARLTEDERAANLPDLPAAWLVGQFTDLDGRHVTVGGESFGEVAEATALTDDQGMRYRVAEHIARHDPARVLAEVKAKRAILEATGAWRHAVSEDCWYTCAAATEEREGEETCDDSRRGEPCDCGMEYRRTQILGPLAAVYADHPDYRQEWAL